jgi:hypothetical protein
MKIEDYDFCSWLADVVPPMRPLVWSLVLKIYTRLSDESACERDFEAALSTAHLLPIETLKQIEVITAHFVTISSQSRHLPIPSLCSPALPFHTLFPGRPQPLPRSRCSHRQPHVLARAPLMLQPISLDFVVILWQWPHQTLPTSAVAPSFRTEIQLHSGHGLPCCRVSETFLLVAPPCAAAAQVVTQAFTHSSILCRSPQDSL